MDQSHDFWSPQNRDVGLRVMGNVGLLRPLPDGFPKIDKGFHTTLLSVYFSSAVNQHT